MKNNIKKIFNKTLKKFIQFFSKDTATDVAVQGEDPYVIQSSNVLEWQEEDRVELTLKYLNSANPTTIDWTGANRVSDNLSRHISVQLGYRVVMFTTEDFLPAGSVTITYKSILGGNLGKPIVPAGSHFAEKSWDPVNGILVLENIYRLDPGSVGFINLLYDLKARNLVSNETGILSDNNINAEVKVTLEGEVVYTSTEGPLSFKIELVKDEFKITKSAEQSINTVDNDPDKDNPNNFYWVDFTVDTSAIYHSRELEKGQIVDILPKDAMLVSVTDFYTRDVLYNSYSTPPELVPYVSYVPDPTGNTGGTITYSFDRSNPKLINLNPLLFKFIVKVKIPLYVEEKTKVNYTEIQGYFEGEQAVYETLNSAQVSTTLEIPGFANWDGFGIYSLRKTAQAEPINVTALQYNDWKTLLSQDYLYYATKSRVTEPVDLVIIDDLSYYRNNSGYFRMYDTEYNFDSVLLYKPVAGINTDYELYVRYEGKAEDDFTLYYSGTIIGTVVSANLLNAILPVVAIKVVYKNVIETFNNTQVLGVSINIKQTDAYTKEPRIIDNSSRLIDYGALDVYRNGESILLMSTSNYEEYLRQRGFTETEIEFLSNLDIETYGHYTIRARAEMTFYLECYRPNHTKSSGVMYYDDNEGLYYARWSLNMQNNYRDLIQNFTMVDILPEGFSFWRTEVWTSDSKYRVNHDVIVDENYKNSGRQRVIVKVTSPDNRADQVIDRFYIRIYAYIDDITKFTPGSIVNNISGLVAKDIPYPSPDIRLASGSYKDDGSYFRNPSLTELWYDADSDRGANDYVWYYNNNITIPQNPEAGRSGIEKYIKTNINPYYSRVGSKATLGSKFEYNLTVNNPQANMRDIIVYDTFPFVGDRFHETNGGQIVPRGSEWSPIFDSITVEAPDRIMYTVYCTTSQEPEDLGIDPSWMEISQFYASGKTPADVKSIAIYFGGYILLQGEYIKIYVTMDAPVNSELKGKVAVNTFYYTFYEGATPKTGESNAINVTIFKPTATIGDTLFFDKNNNSIYESILGETGIGNATVGLYIQVDEEDDNTIIHNGYILKLVDSTTTSNTASTRGTYSFTTDIPGLYFVRFINPNPNIYGEFSEKMENLNPDIQISQVDKNGFTDPIIIDFEASGDKDIDYPFADAGLIPVMGEYNFKKVSDVPEGEYVELGSDTAFSIYDVENKSNDFALENFVLEDVPHKALNFKSISIPAYENADNVKYTVKCKLESSGIIQVVPFGENLNANISHKVDFLVSVQPGDHVDNIYVDFGTVPAGFKAVNSAPIVIEFTLSDDINMFEDIPDNPLFKTADNKAYLKFTVNEEEITYEDDDNIITPVPEVEGFSKESDVPKGEYVIAGYKTTFSIYGVENKNERYALENFTLEDVPHRGLRFTRIIIPAYENALNVRYTVKYKVSSSDDIQVVPGGENLSANENHKVDFTVPIRWFEHVDRIYVEFGTVPVGFKPINGASIVIEFTLSRYIDDFDYLPDSSDLMADNTAYLKYTLNGEDVVLEDNDYVLVKERCGRSCNKPCIKESYVKKVCEKCK